jgi:hypothetical protein
MKKITKIAKVLTKDEQKSITSASMFCPHTPCGSSIGYCVTIMGECLCTTGEIANCPWQ